ncbi:MAG: cation:proton antiporter [Candidatus Bathycorpusculaceae bacterium]
MEDILLLTTVIYVIALIFGYLAQRYLRMPWMFSLVIFGMVFSAFGFFTQVTKSENFQLLANLGMLALLFMIGLDLNLKEIRSLGPYIAGGDLFLCFFEGTVLALLFYFFFPADVGNSFPIALITGVTFGTIGEVVLFAILAEFGLVNTRFGQLSLGMGVFDDVVEVAMLAIIATLPAFSSTGGAQGIPNVMLIVSGLGILLIGTFAIVKIGGRIKKALESIRGPPYVPPFLILLTFFSFAALGGLIYENLAPVAAIMGGIVTQQIFPDKVLKESRKSVNFLGNFFLSPFFFLSLGAKISLASLITFPLLIIVIVLVSFSSRVSASTMLFRKLFGVKYAFILGVGLCAKFSTSIIAENLLFNSGFISTTLFSAIVTAYIIMKPIIVSIYSWGLSTAKSEITKSFSIESSKSLSEEEGGTG